MISEISSLQKDEFVVISLICGIYISQIESRLVFARGWGKKTWGVPINRCKVLVKQDEQALEIC